MTSRSPYLFPSLKILNEAVMVDQSIQEPLSGMPKCNPLSYLTAPVNEIYHEVGELTYPTVLRNG